jgi:hypothetical protein
VPSSAHTWKPAQAPGPPHTLESPGTQASAWPAPWLPPEQPAHPIAMSKNEPRDQARQGAPRPSRLALRDVFIVGARSPNGAQPGTGLFGASSREDIHGGKPDPRRRGSAPPRCQARKVGRSGCRPPCSRTPQAGSAPLREIRLSASAAMTEIPVHPASSDRRRRRSDDPITALHYQLAHTRSEARLDAVVLVDDAGDSDSNRLPAAKHQPAPCALDVTSGRRRLLDAPETYTISVGFTGPIEASGALRCPSSYQVGAEARPLRLRRALGLPVPRPVHAADAVWLVGLMAVRMVDDRLRLVRAPEVL